MLLGIYSQHYGNFNLDKIAENIKSFRVDFSFFIPFIVNFTMLRADIIWSFAVFTLENRSSFCLVLCTTPAIFYFFSCKINLTYLCEYSVIFFQVCIFSNIFFKNGYFYIGYCLFLSFNFFCLLYCKISTF